MPTISQGAGVINGRSSLKTDPIRNFRFIATFLPHEFGTEREIFPIEPRIGFTSISGLTITTESIPYREGGFNTAVHQVPGQSSFSPITFQRGITLGTPQNWNWMRQLFRVIEGAGTGVDATFRCDIEVSVLHHPSPANAASPITIGSTNVADDLKEKAAMRFRIYNAWPTSVAYSDLNAGDNALMVEQLTVVHEGFNVKLADEFNQSAPTFDYDGF
jgi:phage tail-like protein